MAYVYLAKATSPISGVYVDRYIFVPDRGVISNTPEWMGSRFGYMSDRTTLNRFAQAVRGEDSSVKVVGRLDIPEERVKAILRAGQNLPELKRRFGQHQKPLIRLVHMI